MILFYSVSKFSPRLQLNNSGANQIRHRSVFFKFPKKKKPKPCDKPNPCGHENEYRALTRSNMKFTFKVMN